MVTLNQETKSNLEDLIGMKLGILDEFSLDEELGVLSVKNCRNIKFSSKTDMRKVGRGSPLLARKRFKTMEDVNKGLDKIR